MKGYSFLIPSFYLDSRDDVEGFTLKGFADDGLVLEVYFHTVHSQEPEGVFPQVGSVGPRPASASAEVPVQKKGGWMVGYKWRDPTT